MKHRIEGFSDYHYDDVERCVVSYKGKLPRNLKWNGLNKVVVLFGLKGTRKTFTEQDILGMLVKRPSGSVNFDNSYRGAVMENSAMSNKFIIGSKSSNGFSFASKPVEHNTEMSARAEAERLARSNPGRTFVVVKIVGSVVSNAVKWE